MDYKKASDYVWNGAIVFSCAFILFVVGLYLCTGRVTEFKSKNELENLNRKSEIQIPYTESISKIEFENRIGKMKSHIEQIIQDSVEKAEIENDSQRIEIVNIVAGEAGGNSNELQMAVAEVIMNHLSTNSLSEIKPLFDGYKTAEQFGIENWQAVADNVSRVFDNGEVVFGDTDVLYFYNRNLCYSAWHESLNHVADVDGVSFFKS